MGACTFDITGQEYVGNRRIVKGDLTFSSSYATGGDTLALASEVGITEVTGILVGPNTTGASVGIDVTAKGAPKFLLYTSAATQATSASDNDGVTVPVWLFGAG